MIKTLLKIMLFCMITNGVAQNYEFGEVSKEELLNNTYEKDSSANAVILFKNQKTYFNYSRGEGVNAITEVQMRIKILNKEGFNYATHEVNLFKSSRDRESISKITGFTYNIENNSVQQSKLEKSQVFKNEYSYNINQVKFTMPNVKEGSVIEFKYKITSPFYYNIDELVFQYDIPIKKLDVEIRTPKFLIFKNTQKGLMSFSSTKDVKMDHRLGYEVEIESYNLENIPALVEENYVGNIRNYRAGVMMEYVATNFPGQYSPSRSGSWRDVASSIGNTDDYEKQLDKTKSFDDNLDKLIVGEESQLDKLKSIFEYVKKEIKWNGNEGKYFQKGIKKALEEHQGNTGDINLTLVAMLRYAGFNANPVVISTKDNGVPIFPTLERLNYVVAYVEMNGKDYFLDATDEFNDINLMPSKNYNWQGVYINNNTNKYKLISLKKPKQAVGQHQLKSELSSDGSLTGSLKSRYNNHYAQKFRKEYKDLKEEEFISQREDIFYDIEITDYSVENISDVNGNVLESFNFELEDAAEVIGDNIYVEPLSLFKIEENPFKAEKRLYPIDFQFSRKNHFYVSIVMPEGYKVKSSLEPFALTTPNGNAKFMFNVKVVGNVIQLSSVMELVNDVVYPENYQYIKQFYNQVISKGGEKIVLEKI